MTKNSPKSVALCSGTFDPPTFGHLNIIQRGLKVFDKVVIAIAHDSSKKTLFTVEERIELLKEIFKDNPNIKIDHFEGLLVNYAKENGINTILRGIRTVADYEYELQMSLANRYLEPDIETIFMLTEGKFKHISSSIIKQVIKLGGSGKDMIHPFVEERLKEKLLKENS